MFSKLKGVLSKFGSEGSERKKDEKLSKKDLKDQKKVEKLQRKEDKKALKEQKKAQKKVAKLGQKEERKTLAEQKDQGKTNKEGLVPSEKKGFFARLSEKKLASLIEDLEEGLIQNNVAYDVAQEICNGLKKSNRKNIKKDLEKIITEILEKPKQIKLLELAKEKKPLVILFIGVNGAGKTTTVAKLAKWIKNNNKTVVLAAADTFRAAAIEQLQKHADNLDVKLIKHKYGSDAAAVAFDAIDHAKAKNLDFVLIDSAGRSHANQDLMDELAKIRRVAKPDLTILVVDSLTGNDATEQAKMFNEKIGIDGSILTKTDADERGGAIISVGYESGKPILFLGQGQEYKDLKEFDPKEIVKQIID